MEDNNDNTKKTKVQRYEVNYSICQFFFKDLLVWHKFVSACSPLPFHSIAALETSNFKVCKIVLPQRRDFSDAGEENQYCTVLQKDQRSVYTSHSSIQLLYLKKLTLAPDRQAQKKNYHMFQLTEHAKTSTTTKTVVSKCLPRALSPKFDKTPGPADRRSDDLQNFDDDFMQLITSAFEPAMQISPPILRLTRLKMVEPKNKKSDNTLARKNDGLSTQHKGYLATFGNRSSSVVNDCKHMIPRHST